MREREGIVRPDMLHLLMQAKKGTLHDENSEENHKGNTKTRMSSHVLNQAKLQDLSLVLNLELPNCNHSGFIQKANWYFFPQNWMMKTLLLKPSCSSWGASTQLPRLCPSFPTSWQSTLRYRVDFKRRLMRLYRSTMENSHMRQSTVWSTSTWLCQVGKIITNCVHKLHVVFRLLPWEERNKYSNILFH